MIVTRGLGLARRGAIVAFGLGLSAVGQTGPAVLRRLLARALFVRSTPSEIVITQKPNDVWAR